MTRLLVPALIASAIAAAALPSVAGEASLTRIEPRATYGATQTMENGVRVWRTLPATQNMIINPGNATPLNLRIDQYPNYDERTERPYGR